jgi:hypothetical protein
MVAPLSFLAAENPKCPTPNKQIRHAGDRQLDLFHPDDHRVMSFRDWCALNSFSVSTGRRILAGADGPVVTQLSPRRIGITFGANRAWQQSRVRGEV